jgi:hypothetical protein
VCKIVNRNKNVLIAVKSNIPAQFLGCLLVSEYQPANTTGCRADRKNRKYVCDNDGLNVNVMLTLPISCFLATCYQRDKRRRMRLA